MTKEEVIKLIEKELTCYEKFRKTNGCDDLVCEECQYYSDASPMELLGYAFKYLIGE